MELQTNLFINNEYVPSSTGETITISNPNDDSLVSDKIQVASEADVDKAVAAAKAAFPVWRATPGQQRAACMLKFADLIEKNGPRIAKLESIAMGQPISIAGIFVTMSAATWRYFAGLADKIAGESYPENGDGLFKMVTYEPLGVCAGIAAWNATILFTAWKIAPAVAAGNTFIFKASEKSPLGAIALGELIKEAGFPPGVINFVTGTGKVGSLLASHMEIAKISFTGSSTSGRLVQIAAAKSNLKQCTLELGGKSPAIIFNDADVENAVTQNSQGFLVNSGQVCAAASRMLVQEGIAPKIIAAVKEAFINFKGAMGDPASEQTFLGPLADKQQYESVMRFLDEGKKEGIEVLAGGVRKGEKGQFIEPTALLNPSNQSKLYTDEIFGPVLVIKTFKTEEEAVRLANDSIYGLSATIFTSDVTRALRVASNLETGTVSINAAHMPGAQTPFGGVKQSGYGRENGYQGLKAYLQSKTIHINMKMPQKD